MNYLACFAPKPISNFNQTLALISSMPTREISKFSPILCKKYKIEDYIIVYKYIYRK